MFADTPERARAVATYFTLIESSKANGVEPLAYLQHVFAHIAAADTDAALDALSLWNVSSGGFATPPYAELQAHTSERPAP